MLTNDLAELITHVATKCSKEVAIEFILELMSYERVFATSPLTNTRECHEILWSGVPGTVNPNMKLVLV